MSRSYIHEIEADCRFHLWQGILTLSSHPDPTGGVAHWLGLYIDLLVEIYHHAFGACETFNGAASLMDIVPTMIELPVLVVIGAVRIVMAEPEGLYASFDGQVYCIFKGRVSPPLGMTILFIGVLGVVYEEVRSTADVSVLIGHQSTQVPEIQLIVGKKYKRLTILCELEALPAIRMIRREWNALDTAQKATVELARWIFTAKVECGFQLAEVYWKIRGRHLMRDVFGYGTFSVNPATECNCVLIGISWLKEREAHEVIPVGVSEKKTNLENG